jgi:hypothetical protein
MSDFLGPAKVTKAGLDADVTAKINDTGSAARGALNATYGPKLDLFVDQYAAPSFTWGVDDTAPWQAALDAANALGKKARVLATPGKLYKVQPLKFYSNVTIDLRGATLQALVRVGGTNIWDAVLYSAGCPAANGATGDGTTVVNDVEIIGGTIDTLGRTYQAIKVQKANRVAVRRMTFPSNQDKIAIRLDNDTSECVVESCRIISTLDDPFDTIANAQGVSIYSSTVDSTAGAYGLYGTATVNVSTFTAPTNLSQRHKVLKNHIENGTHGVAIQGGDSCLVEGNTIINPSHRGVIVSPVGYRNVITGNLIYGEFSCGVLLAFGSSWNLVEANSAICTSSVSEMNGFRASYGASNNHFVGNYARGVAGAAFRAFTGAINNSFIGNKAENCGTGLEFRSLVTDSGYQQNINTPAMTGNVAQGNTFINCGSGLNIRGGTTTTAGTTPATVAGTIIPLNNCTVMGNTVAGSTAQGAIVSEDTAGSVTALSVFSNAMNTNTGTDWQTPRGSGHFTAFLGNGGAGMASVHRLPATGNAYEWRDSGDALRAYISGSGAMVTSGRRSAGATVTSSVAIDYVNTTGNTQIGLRVDGQSGQTADLQQWTVNATPTGTPVPQTRIGPLGTFITAIHAAPSDATLNAGDMALWFDQTNGASKLMIKAKQADGTVKTGSVSLA